MSLKVFDLQCRQGHVFEGWFSADKGFEQQSERGLLSCPVCGDDAITRKLSAPRLNLGKGSSEPQQSGRQGGNPSGDDASVVAPSASQLAKLQAELFKQVRNLVKSSEDVGSRFAQEALDIHRGDAQERPIRGTATREERLELAEEGISVMPVPDFLDDDRLQ